MERSVSRGGAEPTNGWKDYDAHVSEMYFFLLSITIKRTFSAFIEAQRWMERTSKASWVATTLTKRLGRNLMIS